MKNNIKRGALTAAMVLALFAAGPAPVAAHHSFAPFDMAKERTVTGTVKSIEWTNPHTWVWLDVPNDQGAVDTWGFEGMSPNYLARRGWTRTTLKPGDKISVVFRPLRDGSKGGMFVSTKLADGRMLTMAGASATPSDR
jgi:hypothetical protein